MPRYLSLFHLPLGSDPRPSRCVDVLRRHGDVTVCCLPPSDPGKLEGLTFIPYMPTRRTTQEKLLHGAQLLTGSFEKFIWNKEMRCMLQSLQGQTFDAILCHTLTLLPLACAVARQTGALGHTRILFDAREYYARENEESWRWRVLWQRFNDYLCRHYLPQADAVFTVSPGLAEGYRSEYGIQCQILPSASAWQDLQPRPTQNQNIRLIHHGIASPGRHIEIMIDAIAQTDSRFTLDLMLVHDDSAYYEHLQRVAAKSVRVKIIPPVPLHEIVSNISSYDVGIFLLQPNTFNHIHTLPNKLFEFIQARLAVAVSPVPDMAGLVQQYGIGCVAPDFSSKSFASTLNALTAALIDEYKENTHKAAKKLCWEETSKVLLKALGQEARA